jgi:hypothetical protein
MRRVKLDALAGEALSVEKMTGQQKRIRKPMKANTSFMYCFPRIGCTNNCGEVEEEEKSGERA